MTQGVDRRVGFFGGSFDPPHLGHLAVARAARDGLRLDEVRFAPVGAQPLKPHGSTAPFADRLAMTRLAIRGERGFAVSRIDAPDATGKPNYTLNTLRRLRQEMPGAALYCLMGADSFLSLRKWHGAAEIPFAARLVVASRPGQRLGDLANALPVGLRMEPAPEAAKSEDPAVKVKAYRIRNERDQVAAFYLLPGLDVEISASAIRAQVAGTGGGAKALVPADVERYIRDHGLYR